MTDVAHLKDRILSALVVVGNSDFGKSGKQVGAIRSAASILVQFRPYKQYFRKLNMADAADRAATRTVSGFGFQVCEVIV
jgi:hypothetical protein